MYERDDDSEGARMRTRESLPSGLLTERGARSS